MILTFVVWLNARERAASGRRRPFNPGDGGAKFVRTERVREELTSFSHSRANQQLASVYTAAPPTLSAPARLLAELTRLAVWFVEWTSSSSQRRVPLWANRNARSRLRPASVRVAWPISGERPLPMRWVRVGMMQESCCCVRRPGSSTWSHAAAEIPENRRAGLQVGG